MWHVDISHWFVNLEIMDAVSLKARTKSIKSNSTNHPICSVCVSPPWNVLKAGDTWFAFSVHGSMLCESRGNEVDHNSEGWSGSIQTRDQSAGGTIWKQVGLWQGEAYSASDFSEHSETGVKLTSSLVLRVLQMWSLRRAKTGWLMTVQGESPSLYRPC